MSYDVLVRYRGEMLYCDNYTSNVYKMYRQAFESIGYKDGLNSLDGIDCQSATLILNNVIDYFKLNKRELIKLNPENGWGNYSGALEVLENLYKECLTRSSKCEIEIV